MSTKDDERVPARVLLMSYWLADSVRLNELSERSRRLPFMSEESQPEETLRQREEISRRQEKLALRIQRVGSYLLGQTIKLSEPSTPLTAAKHIRRMIERGCPDEEVSWFLMAWRPTPKEKNRFFPKKKAYGKNRVANDTPLLALELFESGKSWPEVTDELIAIGKLRCVHRDNPQHLPKHSSETSCCMNVEASVHDLRTFLRELESSQAAGALSGEV